MTQGMGSSVKTQWNMLTQRSDVLRQISQTNDEVHGNGRGTRFCVVCNQSKDPGEVQEYDAGDVCDSCADEWGIYSNDDLLNWKSENGIPF